MHKLMSFSCVSAVSVSAFAGFLALVQAAQGLEWVVADSRLPVAIYGHSAVYDGADSIYIIGGYNHAHLYQTQVVKYSIASGDIEDLGTFIPKAFGAAVMDSDSGDIYYFGGLNDTSFSADVHKFSTRTPSYQIVNHLPVAVEEFGLAFDSRQGRKTAYILGGGGEEPYVDNIVAYDVSSNTVGQGGRLQTGRWGLTAVWAPRRDTGTDAGLVYIFGGYNGVPLSGQDILQYNPANGFVAKLAATLPHTSQWGCAVLVDKDDDEQVYLLGSERLIKFDPTSGRATAVEVEGYQELLYPACVYVPDLERIYVFGGYPYGSGLTDVTLPLNKTGVDGRGRRWPLPIAMQTDQIAYIDLSSRSETTTSTERPPPADCADGATRVIPNPFCCESFYFCHGGVGTKVECEGGHHFNPGTLQCEDAGVVQCGLTYGHVGRQILAVLGKIFSVFY